MRTKKQNKTRKLCVVQTRVSASVSARLDVLIAKYGFASRYELLQYLITSFLSYADNQDHSCISLEIEDEQSLNLYKAGKTLYSDFVQPELRLNTAVTTSAASLDLQDALFIYGKSGAARSVCRTVDPQSGELVPSGASAAIDLVLRRLVPQQYDRLTSIADDLGSKSALSALDYLLSAYSCPAPGAGSYSQNEYGTVPVRHNNKTID